MRIIKQKGITLIEILAVFFILVIISSVAVVNFRGYQSTARDARRIDDLQQVRRALQFYYQENGSYPNQSTFSITSGTHPTNWVPSLENFLPILPIDPLNTGSQPFNTNGYTYLYSSFTPYQNYNLLAHLEDSENEESCNNRCWQFNSDSGLPPGARTGESWCTSSIPGVSCGGDANGASKNLYSDHQ